MPRSYPLFLVAILAGGGWYFTKGPGAGKFGDVLASCHARANRLRTKPRPPATTRPLRTIRTTRTTNRSRRRRYAKCRRATRLSPRRPRRTRRPRPCSAAPRFASPRSTSRCSATRRHRSRTSWPRWPPIIQNFHVVAIQEIRTQDDYFLDNFLRTYVNENGRVYDKVIGPRLGRSNSKEQYAFLYDTAAIEVNRRSVFTVNDPDDLLAPRAAGGDVPRPRPAAGASIHVRPRQYAHRSRRDRHRAQHARARCTRPSAARRGGEDDIILLGDLNVDDKHLGDLGQLDGVRPIVRSTFTNTRQNAQYDNIIFHQPSTTEFSGRWGVFDFQRLHNLTPDQALQVSDHLPDLGRVQRLRKRDARPRCESRRECRRSSRLQPQVSRGSTAGTSAMADSSTASAWRCRMRYGTGIAMAPMRLIVGTVALRFVVRADSAPARFVDDLLDLVGRIDFFRRLGMPAASAWALASVNAARKSCVAHLLSQLPLAVGVASRPRAPSRRRFPASSIFSSIMPARIA